MKIIFYIILIISLIFLLRIDEKVSKNLKKSEKKIIYLNKEIYEVSIKRDNWKNLSNSLKRIKGKYKTTKDLNDKWIRELSNYYKYYPKLKILVEELKKKDNSNWGQVTNSKL